MQSNMRKVQYITSFVFLFWSQFASSQDTLIYTKPQRKNFIGIVLPSGITLIGKLGVQSKLVGVSYERSLNKRMSLGGEASIYGGFTVIRSGTLSLEYRYYLNVNDTITRNKGWYVGGQFLFGYLEYRNKNSYGAEKTSNTAIDLSVVGGHQFVFRNNLFLNLGVIVGGALWGQYYINDELQPEAQNLPFGEGLLKRLNLGTTVRFGYTF